MSVASKILKLLEESRASKTGSDPQEILLSADSRELLAEVLTSISQKKKIARIVEGAVNYNVPPDRYRKDTRHAPHGMSHFHVFRHKNQVGVVNIDGTGHDGYSGTRLNRNQGNFLRSKGVNLPKNNVIATKLIESFEPRYVVVISEAELLELLWETEN
jgi:hypothetical protein